MWYKEIGIMGNCGYCIHAEIGMLGFIWDNCMIVCMNDGIAVGRRVMTSWKVQNEPWERGGTKSYEKWDREI